MELKRNIKPSVLLQKQETWVHVLCLAGTWDLVVENAETTHGTEQDQELPVTTGPGTEGGVFQLCQVLLFTLLCPK